jgi:integrase
LTACVQREDKSLPRKADGSLVLGADGLPKYSPIGLLDEFFGGLRVKKIQRLLVDEFVNREQARGLANGTINRSISKLKAMFNLAKEKGTLRDADIPPSWPVLPEASPRRGFFEPGEYRALLTALPGHLKPLLAIGYATGLRVGEIRGLRWEQVDFLGGLIRLRDRETKNNEARSAPLTSDLRAILLAHRAACPKDFPWVCFAFDTAGHAQKIKSFDRCWQNTCVKIGLGRWAQAVHSVTGEPLFDKPGGPRSEPKPKMTYDGKLFHDLRRSGIRNLVRAGVTQDVAQKISGHRTASVFSRYNVTDERDIIDAGKLLDKFNGEQIRGSSGAVLQIPEEANQLKN